MDSSEQDLPETDATLPHTEEELREIVRDIIGEDDETPKTELRDLTPAEKEVLQAAKDSRQPRPEEHQRPKSDDELRMVVGDIAREILVQRALAGTAASEWIPSGWRRLGTRRTGVLAGVLLALWLSLFVYAALSHRNETIPDELLGMWTTSASKYADRYFEIGPTWLRFDTGTTNVLVYRIANVGSSEEGNATLYRVEYLIGEGAYTFSFLYEQFPEAVIRFENQPLIAWRKGTS